MLSSSRSEARERASLPFRDLPIRAPAVVSLALIGLLPALGDSCARATPPPARTWPAGTVLALNDVPITVDDVDAVGSIIARTEPQDALPQLRRIALTNVLFPRMAAAQLAGPKREEARALAKACKREADTGSSLEGPRVGILRQEREGYFKAIGLEAWNYAVDAEIGRWSEPLETVGAFELVRVNERTRAGAPRDVFLKVTVVVVAYVDAADPRTGVEALLDRSKLEYVDDAWRDVVPEYWKHRLRGGSP
jgi:hypothetical protein